jgi:dihydroneopterin aldolase
MSDCHPPARTYASLRLSRVVVPVRLGWSDAERASPQPVAVDLELRFATPPAACDTDRLADAVDYAALVGRVGALAASAEHRLIEHLARVLRDGLRSLLPEGTGLAVTVSKQPRLASLEGGASFRIGDWPGEVGGD